MISLHGGSRRKQLCSRLWTLRAVQSSSQKWDFRERWLRALSTCGEHIEYSSPPFWLHLGFLLLAVYYSRTFFFFNKKYLMFRIPLTLTNNSNPILGRQALLRVGRQQSLQCFSWSCNTGLGQHGSHPDRAMQKHVVHHGLLHEDQGIRNHMYPNAS